MRRLEQPITAFRRRLLRLIDEQCEGKYTALARRAGIPTSTMEHYIHHAKHLPGGEHLQKLAQALGVTVQYLVAGDEAVPVAERAAQPTPGVLTRGEPQAPRPGIAAHLSIPMFACGCPGPCPLAVPVPLPRTAFSRLVVEKELLPMHETHRLVAVQVDPTLLCAEWPEGARLVVDLDAPTLRWEALTLLRAEGRCQVGHVLQHEAGLVFAPRLNGEPRVILGAWRILGTMVAAVTKL